MIDTFLSLDLPTIVIIYIIPTVLFSIAIKTILDKIRIFHSSVVNWIISIAVALSTTYFFRGAYSIIMALSIFAICVFKIRGVKGFLIGIAAAGIYFVFVLPLLLSFLG